MRSFSKWWVVLSAAVVAGGVAGCGGGGQGAGGEEAAAVATPATATVQAAIPAGIPTGDQWVAHVSGDIMPFWSTPEALGTPVGNFPTWRCNDGTVAHPPALTCEYANLGGFDGWILSPYQAGQDDFIRMKSRQSFGYAVAYQLTGDERFLRWHLDGLDWIRRHGIAWKNGVVGGEVTGVYSYFVGGVPAGVDARTAQDTGYAILAFAMDYYLTRDPAVLDELRKLRSFFLATYWPDRGVAGGFGMPRWTPNDTVSQEIVSSLDQVNTYLLPTIPLLPSCEQAAWKQELRELMTIVRQRFYSPENQLFWGVLASVDPNEKPEIGGWHTDFGHTIKASYLTYLSGKLLGEPEWVAFGEQVARTTFQRAYITSSSVFGYTGEGYHFVPSAYLGAWGSGLTNQQSTLPGSIWPGSEWWSYTELDEMAATLAVNDPSYVAYLQTTYPRFFERLVDHAGHGIYDIVETAQEVNPNIKYTKANLWKASFHESEHALVGYLTSQELRAQPSKLYFALHRNKVNAVLRPYWFTGKLKSTKTSALADPALAAYQQVQATFTGINK